MSFENKNLIMKKVFRNYIKDKSSIYVCDINFDDECDVELVVL